MKRKRYPVYKEGSSSYSPPYTASFNNQPKCTICLQGYTNRTFVRDCFHSFCFVCIRQWINIVPECPLCKGVIHALIYNIIEDLNTYQEYRLADKKPNSTKHHPTVLGNDSSFLATTAAGRLKQAQHHRPWLKRRRALYRYLPGVISYPQPLPRLSSLSIIQPDHIPKIIPFLQSELQAILGTAYDPFIETQLENILLMPYNTTISNSANTDRPSRITRDNKSILPMTLQQQQRQKQPSMPSPQPSSSATASMYDTNVIQQLSDWLNESDRVSRRLLDELLAYLKSGRSYIDFINTAQYQQIQQDKDDDDDDDDDPATNDPGPSSSQHQSLWQQ